jgi:deoxyribonuclease V
MNMNYSPSAVSHPWRVSLDEAKQIQRKLSQQVILQDDFRKIEKVLGVGVIFSKDQEEVFVSCASFALPGLEVQKTVLHKERLSFPYTPGFFAFSTGSAILSALKRIERPDLIMFPGRGIAHPRGLGLASHLGLLLDIPTIACSKRPLWRGYPKLSHDKGAHVLVKGEDERLVGAVIRIREGKNPVFVSPGHKISVQTAVKIVHQCSPRYRIPEPLRQARILAKRKAEGEAIGAR